MHPQLAKERGGSQEAIDCAQYLTRSVPENPAKLGKTDEDDAFVTGINDQAPCESARFKVHATKHTFRADARRLFGVL